MTEDDYLELSRQDTLLSLKLQKEIGKFHFVENKVGLLTFLVQQIIEEKKDSGQESMDDFIYRITADMESIWLTGDTR